MTRVINSIVKHRKFVLAVFGILLIISAVMLTQVRVNYNMQDYLPKNQPSVTAVTKLDEEFSTTIPNARAVFPIHSVREGLEIKQKLLETEGIRQVLWLDDQIDLSIPLEMADKATVEAFYKDGDALYQISALTKNANNVLDRIYALSPDVKVSGQLVDLATAQTAVQSEMLTITLFIVPIIFLILLWATHAWLEPVVFMAAIGVGVLLNMGTNVFLGEISFITQAVGSVIQLAVSMDYAIFLLNRFNDYRSQGYDSDTAMAKAMRKALTSIASSAATTVFGFLALIFMRFRIGGDLGVVMAKGILFSFLSVMIFMPCFLLLIYRLMDKTTHRYLLPDFAFMGRGVMKVRWLIVIIALALIGPAYLARGANHFIYGMGGYPKNSRAYKDVNYITDVFGQQTQISLLVPRGDMQNEQRLQNDLVKDKDIISVISYVNMADPAIPMEVASDSRLSMLVSDHYTQYIITAGVGSEGDRAFGLAERLRETAAKYYGDKYYMTGQNLIMLDMKNTIRADDLVVNTLAVLAIALVIAIAFKSVSLPFVLVLTIELAIWLNLSVPYFMGNKLSYIGYLIISTVQLGATVDYAILYTVHYLDNRKRMNKRQAVVQSSRETIPSLLPPAMILTAAGIGLQYTSSLTIVSELGEVLGRGAVFSFFMVVLLLPCNLYFMDKLIEKTTKGADFAPAHCPDIVIKNGRPEGEYIPSEMTAGKPPANTQTAAAEQAKKVSVQAGLPPDAAAAKSERMRGRGRTRQENKFSAGEEEEK